MSVLVLENRINHLERDLNTSGEHKIILERRVEKCAPKEGRWRKELSNLNQVAEMCEWHPEGYNNLTPNQLYRRNGIPEWLSDLSINRKSLGEENKKQNELQQCLEEAKYILTSFLAAVEAEELKEIKNLWEPFKDTLVPPSAFKDTLVPPSAFKRSETYPMAPEDFKPIDLRKASTGLPTGLGKMRKSMWRKFSF